MQEPEYAKTYELERTFWWFWAKRRVAGTMLSGIESSPASSAERRPPRILDVGCGTGGNLEWLRRRGRCFGVDLSETALDYCRSRAGEAPPDEACQTQVSLACGRLEALPFAGGSFDLVTAFDVLYHEWVFDDAAALREVARVCRPGGFVLITDSALPFLRGPHDEAYGCARRYTRATLRRVVEQAGLRMRRMSYFHFLLFPLIAAVRLSGRLFCSGGGAKSDLEPVHPALNGVLKAVCGVECLLLRVVPLPVGSSIVCLAQKNERA